MCFPPLVQIILHSMHKYQPRVHVIRKECGEELSPVRTIPAGEGTRTFSFPETVFTTVTAYQNQQVAQLNSSVETHKLNITKYSQSPRKSHFQCVLLRCAVNLKTHDVILDVVVVK